MQASGLTVGGGVVYMMRSGMPWPWPWPVVRIPWDTISNGTLTE